MKTTAILGCLLLAAMVSATSLDGADSGTGITEATSASTIQAQILAAKNTVKDLQDALRLKKKELKMLEDQLKELQILYQQAKPNKKEPLLKQILQIQKDIEKNLAEQKQLEENLRQTIAFLERLTNQPTQRTGQSGMAKPSSTIPATSQKPSVRLPGGTGKKQ